MMDRAKPRPDITVRDDEDGGETITVTAPGGIVGTREAGIQVTRMRISRNGPLIRWLLTGHV